MAGLQVRPIEHEEVREPRNDGAHVGLGVVVLPRVAQGDTAPPDGLVGVDEAQYVEPGGHDEHVGRVGDRRPR